MDVLKELMLQYKIITCDLIEYVSVDEFELLEEKINKRQGIIDRINTLTYTKEGFKEACNEFQIIELTRNLNELLDKKRKELRVKIHSLASTKSANRSYNRNANVDSLFFNQKI